MKNICLYCGCATWFNRRYCCSECSQEMFKITPCTVKKHFDIFKNLVAAAENYDEFKKLYTKYFKT